MIKVSTKPRDMDGCVYFTSRAFENGRAVAWAIRKLCSKCKSSNLSNPLKNGKPDKKSDVYVCRKCGYLESREEAEKDIRLNIEYTCPYCQNNGETTTEYKRKIFEGVPSFVFECQKCRRKIGLTKKMKDSKKKKGNADAEPENE